MLVGAIVLTGGRSSRMGRPKESLPFGGTTLLGRTVETLLDCTWPVVVVARPDQELPPLPLEARVVHDEQPGRGPLQAIATGLRWLREHGGLGERDAAFVTGCDAPFLRGDMVQFLASRLGEDQLAAPRVGGVLQPLVAIYRLDALATIETLLREGIDAPKALPERVRTRIVDEQELRALDPELKFAVAVNTPEEYQRALAADV